MVVNMKVLKKLFSVNNYQKKSRRRQVRKTKKRATEWQIQNPEECYPKPHKGLNQNSILQLSRGFPVGKSFGSKPGVAVVVERVRIRGLSRFRNLSKFAHSMKVKVLPVDPNVRIPNRYLFPYVCICEAYLLLKNLFVHGMNMYLINEAAETINKGEFIIEHIGEVIDDALYEKRLWDMKYGAVQNFYICEIRKDFTIDATFKGNMACFLNHGCDPNCVLEKWLVPNLLFIGFINSLLY
ncbi:hypothetical protein HN51_007174 [Arachis hypogaea]